MEDHFWFKGSPSKDRSRDLISGMISGFVCKTFEYPFDTIKVLQQTSPKYGSQTAFQVFNTTYQTGGVKALYQGLTSPLIGAMFENATLFVAYGMMKTALDVNPAPTLSDPVPMWKYYLAGAGSGICSAFVLTPVELVKCRLQIQQGAGTKEYKGPIDVISKTVKSKGIQGLWQGNMSCLVREIPGNIAWFGAYELVKQRIQIHFRYEKMEEVPLYWTAFAGSVAGVAYWAVPFPADTVKSRLQTNPDFEGLSFQQALRKVVKAEGISGLYGGLGVTAARAAPAHALIFVFYELASNILAKF